MGGEEICWFSSLWRHESKWSLQFFSMFAMVMGHVFLIYGDPSKLDKPTYCNAKRDYNHHWPQTQGVLERSFLDVMASDIDFWIQVTKQLGRISGSQTHTTILTTTNENSEIRCCNLVATKAHSQYELTLICVRNSLDLYGLSQPLLAYTDNMSGKGLLEMISRSTVCHQMPKLSSRMNHHQSMQQWRLFSMMFPLMIQMHRLL
jgi:hypothetical protein